VRGAQNKKEGDRREKGNPRAKTGDLTARGEGKDTEKKTGRKFLKRVGLTGRQSPEKVSQS